MSPLTFEEWDRTPTGALEDFPSHTVQPAEPEPEHYADGRRLTLPE